MRVKTLTPCTSRFADAPDGNSQKNNVQKPDKKSGLLDKFETSIINSADLNDTIQVPRTIFKGYLAFMAGTALTTIAAMAKNKHEKFSNSLNVLSVGLVIWGTYSFVRPYIIKSPKENTKS